MEPTGLNNLNFPRGTGDLCEEIVRRKGIIHQLRKLQEESAELSAAVGRFLDKDRDIPKSQLHKEIADVLFLINQVLPIIGAEGVEEQLEVTAEQVKEYLRINE